MSNFDEKINLISLKVSEHDSNDLDLSIKVARLDERLISLSSNVNDLKVEQFNVTNKIHELDKKVSNGQIIIATLVVLIPIILEILNFYFKN